MSLLILTVFIFYSCACNDILELGNSFDHYNVKGELTEPIRGHEGKNSYLRIPR